MDNTHANSQPSNLKMLHIENLSFSYYHKSAKKSKYSLQKPLVTEQKVLKNLSLSLYKGETVVIGGPSGCGKSTLLRLVAGFETPKTGSIFLNGQLCSSSKYCVPPEKRRIGFVFQDHALFPQMTVEKNIRFGIGHIDKEEQKSRTVDILHKIKLSNFAKRYPDELSIGQMQRVALARALVLNPSLLMLDEPFSSIDKDTSIHLIEELQEIKSAETAMLVVTHESFEALYLADKIILINDGSVMQSGSPEELYCRPKNRNVAAYFDEVNYLPIQQSVCGQLCSPCGFIDKRRIENYSFFKDKEFFHLCIRPHMIEIRTNIKARYQQENWVVIKKYFMGHHYKILLESIHPIFQGLRIIVVQNLSALWPQEKETIQMVVTAKFLWGLEGPCSEMDMISQKISQN